MNTQAFSVVSGVLDISDLPAFLKSLNDFSAEYGVKVQGFDARKIADADHLMFAIHRACEAFAAGTNQAKDIGLESMRFLSGSRKIDKAFSMGLVQGENRGLFVFFGEADERMMSAQNAFSTAFGLKKDISLSIDEKKPFLMEQFGISDDELNTAGAGGLKLLVMERVALVDIIR